MKSLYNEILEQKIKFEADAEERKRQAEAAERERIRVEQEKIKNEKMLQKAQIASRNKMIFKVVCGIICLFLLGFVYNHHFIITVDSTGIQCFFALQAIAILGSYIFIPDFSDVTPYMCAMAGAILGVWYGCAIANSNDLLVEFINYILLPVGYGALCSFCGFGIGWLVKLIATQS